MNFVWETPEEINLALARRFQRIRKRRGLSQLQLSEKSNVSFGSIKRFETSGQISLISLTKLCVALDCVDEIRSLFNNVEYTSIEEVIRERT
jgi:transcriptional regulator with XRE-family HTH domain